MRRTASNATTDPSVAIASTRRVRGVRPSLSSVTPVTEQTAPYLLELGERLLHFSPEAKVVEIILDAALLLQRADKIALYAPRYAAAFPEDYARWRQAHADLVLP
jgi:hypothetical protein